MDKAYEFMKRHGMSADCIDFKRDTDAFLRSMELGLCEKRDTVPMIPAYLRCDRSVPKGRYAAVIDAGGTNFRTALVSFGDDGASLSELEKRQMPGAEREADWAQFISGTADLIEPLMNKTDRIGFCFSYPALVTPDCDSRVLSLTKQVKLRGAVGSFAGRDLKRELERRGCSVSRIVVLNDTPATLLGGAALLEKSDYSSFVGLVAGTGVNTCCILPVGRITKLGRNDGYSMLVNCESGSFDGFSRGSFDLELDARLPDTGRYIYEKMCSGAYLGEVCRHTLLGACGEGLIGGAAAEYLRGLKKLETPEADEWLCGKTPSAFDSADRDVLVYITSHLFDRAARCICCNLCAILRLTDDGSEKPVCISVDGSLFKRSEAFRAALERHMASFAHRPFKFVTGSETSLLGAAAAALIN